MNTRSGAFVLFFLALLVSPWVVEPAYYGFLVAFAVLVCVQAEWNGIPVRVPGRLSVFAVVLACILLVMMSVTWSRSPAWRDVLRDTGALLAFFIGRYLFVAYRDTTFPIEVLKALSVVGIVVALVTLGAAALALQAGVSAYIWRGEYVPWGHQWLPYSMAANVFLMTADRQHVRRYGWCAALCVLGTVASLSRTDLALELLFGAALAYRFRRQLLLRFAGFTRLVMALIVLAFVAPFLLRLQVVQQRIDVGLSERDPSLSWRFMENVALLDYFREGSAYDVLFGFGLGARMPLPPGVLDFNGNTSIPHLHNSFGTIALKFGLVGLCGLAWYLLRVLKRSLALRHVLGEPYRQAGRWVVLLCLGKALTLQALSEWSHLVFFGIGCMLALSAPRTMYRLITGPRSELLAPMGLGETARAQVPEKGVG